MFKPHTLHILHALKVRPKFHILW